MNDEVDNIANDDAFDEKPLNLAAAVSFAEKEAISFMDLADLESNATVAALRGQSEFSLAKKIKLAESFLLIVELFLDSQDSPEPYATLYASIADYHIKLSVIKSRLGFGR